jgi:hypothetical protein
MVSSLIAQVFRGDPKALLAHLVSEREVAPGDLERVRALLRDSDSSDRDGDRASAPARKRKPQSKGEGRA